MDDNKFWVFSKAGDHAREMYLTNQISSRESWWEDTVTPQRFREELFSGAGDVRVWLDSPGGDAFAGNAIYDMLREYSASGRGRIIAMISLAASAASIVAMAADEIRISVLGTIMIHEPWSDVAGPAARHIAAAKVLESVRDAQIEAYARRTGNDREAVRKMMQGSDGNGTYMNANEAVKLGFADVIVDGSEELNDFRQRVAAMMIRDADVSAGALIMSAAGRIGAKDADRTAKDEARRALLRAVIDTY